MNLYKQLYLSTFNQDILTKIQKRQNDGSKEKQNRCLNRTFLFLEGYIPPINFQAFK